MKFFLIITLFMIISCDKVNGDNGSPPTTPPPAATTGNNIRIVIGDKTFNATLFDTPSAAAFKALLPITISMRELNGNEKYYDLPSGLPTSAVRQETIRNGDIMLYGSSTLVLFYKTFSTSYSYTRIGRVINSSEFENALGRGNVTVKFESI